eukprot:tig00020746_g13673.t1
MPRQRDPLWDKYAPANVVRDARAEEMLAALEAFFNTKGRSAVEHHLQGQPVQFEINNLSKLCSLSGTTLAEELRIRPDTVLACIRVAVERAASRGNAGPPGQRVRLRVHDDYIEESRIADLRSSALDQFVAIRGTVIRTGTMEPWIFSMNFTCSRCRKPVRQPFPDGKWRAPSSCPATGCTSRSFVADRSSAELIDSQELRVQEVHVSGEDDAGGVPRCIECVVFDEQVNQCVPGDVLRVYGILRTRDESDAPTGSGKQRSASFAAGRGVGGGVGSERQLEAAHVVVEKKVSVQGDSLATSGEDIVWIRRIAAHPKCFELVSRSLCPQIIGHETVKAGLVLGLMGGVPKFANSSSKLALRGSSHVLLVGDPGVGKSQLLKACAAAAPRGIFVASNMSTASGLTVAVAKDSNGNFALEAGALVLADQGVCCIDELDKSSTSEHDALLEAMEQQTVSVAKAGISASCMARTTVIAAANPVSGSYNKAKPVSENLKISPAILSRQTSRARAAVRAPPPSTLSRFDLIFLMEDLHDQGRDEALSRHLLRKRALEAGPAPSSAPSSSSSASASASSSAPSELVPHGLLREYFAYARHACKPTLSDGAIRQLQDFYVELRRGYRDAEGSPVTSRQLESLARLAEARARCELRPVATLEDARELYHEARRLREFKSLLEFQRLVGAWNEQGLLLRAPGGLLRINV